MAFWLLNSQFNIPTCNSYIILDWLFSERTEMELFLLKLKHFWLKEVFLMEEKN